jgi:hypothetical protein
MEDVHYFQSAVDLVAWSAETVPSEEDGVRVDSDLEQFSREMTSSTGLLFVRGI